MKRIAILLTIALFIGGTINAQETKENPKAENTIKTSDIKFEQEALYYDEEKTKIKIQTSFYKKDGKKISHGPSKSFWPNGNLATELNFLEGLINGQEIHYNIKGEKEIEIEWSKGIQLKQKEYKDSKLISDTEVKTLEVKSLEATKPDTKKIVKNGQQINYYLDGSIQQKVSWKEDVKNGIETLYFKNGQKKEEINWLNGVKEGIQTIWFENGKMSIIINWAIGKEQGEMVNYHENGTKKDLIEFDKGIIVNTRTSWNDSGSIIGQCLYKDGKPHKGTLFDIENLLLLTFENGRQISSKVCDRSGILKQ